jgi:hypothetical protein
VEHFADAHNPVIDRCVKSRRSGPGSAFSGAITISIDANDTHLMAEFFVGPIVFRSP